MIYFFAGGPAGAGAEPLDEGKFSGIVVVFF